MTHLILCLGFVACSIAAGALPQEPINIGREPQFVFDLQVVDTTWALKLKGEPVKRVLHQAVKHAGNPLITGDARSRSAAVNHAVACRA